MKSTNGVASVNDFIERIAEVTPDWKYRWFRGEPACELPLLPTLYRVKPDGTYHDENKLLQLFRMKAPTFASPLPIPNREHTDQWLFLAAHVGLPTRLLDWTENALAALHFALLSDPERKWINIASENINAAWELDSRGLTLPVAVLPTNIHPRMSVQRSCFTVHGRDKRPLSAQVPSVLVRLAVDASKRQEMRENLRTLGVDHSTLFPDLDHLARELCDRY